MAGEWWARGGNILIDADTPVVRQEDPLSPRVLLTTLRECSARIKAREAEKDDEH